jgi:hypothetical protein
MRKNLLVAILGVALSGCLSTGGALATCDRACLSGRLDAYLGALQKHDLSSVGLAPSFRATQNGIGLARGDGHASSLIALGDVQRKYLDPVSGQAAYLGLIKETVGTALVAIRIRIEGNVVVESEEFVARQGDTLFSPDGFEALPPRIPNALPRSDRRPRAEMIAAADSYFEGLATHNSVGIPRVEGCDRLENGTRVTNRPPRTAPVGAAAVEFGATDCASGLERMTQISGVAHRRFPLVDEEAGVVMGIGLFLRPPGQTGNFAKRNLLTEFFEVTRGKLSGIYAVMHYLDADAPDSTGWP